MPRVKTHVTDADYHEVLSAWLDKPTVKYVVEQTGFSRAVVQRLTKEGVPELGLAPLPQPAKKKGRRFIAKDKVPERNSTLVSNQDRSKAAQMLVAHQEISAQVARLKEKLATLENEGATLGDLADASELEQEIDGTLASIELAKKKVELDTKRLNAVEDKAIAHHNIERSAGEAAIAKQALRICVNQAAIMGHLTDKILAGVENGSIELPEAIDAKLLSSMASSADRLTAAMERALKIDKGKAGEPEKVLGVQIGILLESCSPEELEYFHENGALPPRLRTVVEAKAS